MPEKLINVKEVQEMLGVSERTIFRLLKTGELTGFKAGREWRFEKEDITAYIARQRDLAKQQQQKAV